MSELKTIEVIQEEVGAWAEKNFGKNVQSKATGQELGSISPLLGMMEELGELTHAVLKRHQGIRGFGDDGSMVGDLITLPDFSQKYIEARDDAVADAMIFLMHFCSLEGINLIEVVNKTWSEVQQRDWKKNRFDGGENQNG